MLRRCQRQPRIGAWIATLDIVHAELVQHTGDRNLVLDRKVDARRLLAIAQCRVEEVEAVALHGHFPAYLSVARIRLSRMPGSE